MKSKISNIVLILMFIIGLSLLLYPSVSDYWNSFHQSQAIQTYSKEVADINQDEYEKIINSAREYNDKIAHYGQSMILSEAEKNDYYEELNISGNGIMSYIEIPKISCTLPIYHGTDNVVLQIAIGHIEGTSLPVGGENTHCVVSGHRGLPSAKLFSNLNQLVEGDIFMLQTLDETLTYEVDQIRIVLPEEIDEIRIIEGEDLCTLVTCTPYGINTHRLLVRGHRIENIEDSFNIRVTADAIQIEPVVVAPAIAIPILVILLIYLMIRYRKRG